jgi:hypothetical protein
VLEAGDFDPQDRLGALIAEGELTGLFQRLFEQGGVVRGETFLTPKNPFRPM